MRYLAIFLLLVSLSGCEYWASWRLLQAQGDLTRERSEIVRLYRECLQANPGPAGKTQCEHFTQALLSLDVRGVK